MKTFNIGDPVILDNNGISWIIKPCPPIGTRGIIKHSDYPEYGNSYTVEWHEENKEPWVGMAYPSMLHGWTGVTE